MNCQGLCGDDLFQREVDCSNLPLGGLRGPNKGTGYMTWDKTGVPFVFNKTLFIPAALVSKDGHALDEKTPILRSQAAIDRAGSRLVSFFFNA